MYSCKNFVQNIKREFEKKKASIALHPYTVLTMPTGTFLVFDSSVGSFKK